MGITSSTYALGDVQADGRREVVETHNTPAGYPYVARYMAEPGTDYQAVMLARIPKLERRLALWEFTRIVAADPAILVLRHQTGADFATRFWAEVTETHRQNNKFAYARLLWWVYEMVLAGYLTSAQVRTAYNVHYNKNLTIAQWNALATARLIPAHARYAEMMAEQGV